MSVFRRPSVNSLNPSLFKKSYLSFGVRANGQSSRKSIFSLSRSSEHSFNSLRASSVRLYPRSFVTPPLLRSSSGFPRAALLTFGSPCATQSATLPFSRAGLSFRPHPRRSRAVLTFHPLQDPPTIPQKPAHNAPGATRPPVLSPNRAHTYSVSDPSTNSRTKAVAPLPKVQASTLRCPKSLIEPAQNDQRILPPPLSPQLLPDKRSRAQRRSEHYMVQPDQGQQVRPK